MAKKQIKISQNDIRRMIKEAVDAAGYTRFPDGVFSTDSDEGNDLMVKMNKYVNPSKGNKLRWDPVERKLKDFGDNVTGEKWEDNPESVMDSYEKRDKVARDKYKDEKADSDRFEKPFGEYDDEIENQWDDEPGYADEPDDDEIAGIDESKKIRLNEKQLREFVSYSVAKLLKEGMRPIYDKHGEWDGDEYSPYGSDSFVFEPDIDKYLGDDVDFPEYPKVRVEYTKTEGMKGDGYLQPDDPDEYTLDGWDIVNKENLPQEAIEAVKMYMENDFDLEEEAIEHEGYLEEGENRGIMAHFDGKDTFKPKNPYENMTWDEYCAAKKKEREDDENKKKLHDVNYPEEKKDRERNRGIMTHIPGKKEDDGKIRITEQDIAKMVKKAVNEISKGLLDRARSAAHKDMMRNFGDSKTRQKRERQWKKFGDEYRRMDSEEKDSICPQVDERDLVNMPEDTYVIMNGDGRDAVNANFRSSYSGRAGTKEQCEEFVNRFYDKGANWEYLPEIVPLKDYLRRK